MSRRRKSPATLIFAGLVAALAAYTIWDFKQAKTREGLSDGEVRILSLPSDQITSLLIQSKDQTVEVTKDEGRWKMLKPLQDDADDSAVSSFLNTLAEAKSQPVGDSGSKISDWKSYGLDPGVTIEVKGSGKTERFDVSDKSAFDGSFYIRKGDKLLLGDRSWAHVTDKQSGSLRSHKIWRTPGDINKVVLGLDLAGKKHNVTLNETAGGWDAQPKFDLPVSSQKMGNFLKTVRDLQASDFVAEKPAPKDLEKFLLKKPSLTLEFSVKKDGHEALVHWEIGQEESEHYFLHSDTRDEIYKVSKFALRDILQPAEMLLNTSDAVKVLTEEAMKIEFEHNGGTLKFTRGEKGWNENGVATHTEALADFLQKIRSLDPVPGDLPKGLEFKPSERLTIRGKANILLEMQWTAEKDRNVWLKIGTLRERFKVTAPRFKQILETDFGPKKQANGKN